MRRRFAALLTGTLPQLIDGGEGRAWVAGHDQIDYGLLDAALAGLPAARRPAGAGGVRAVARLRFAIDATPYPAAGRRMLARPRARPS